jgi:hypothetical protein
MDKRVTISFNPDTNGLNIDVGGCFVFEAMGLLRTAIAILECQIADKYPRTPKKPAKKKS